MRLGEKKNTPQKRPKHGGPLSSSLFWAVEVSSHNKLPQAWLEVPAMFFGAGYGWAVPIAGLNRAKWFFVCFLTKNTEAAQRFQPLLRGKVRESSFFVRETEG